MPEAYVDPSGIASLVNPDAVRVSVVLPCRLSRIASGDTFGAADAFALSVDFHYQCESAGSVDEYPTP